MKEHFVCISTMDPLLVERITSFFFLSLAKGLESSLATLVDKKTSKKITKQNMHWRRLVEHYYQFARRRISMEKREVFESQFLKNQDLYGTPEYRLFIKKIEEGEDLTPYLSKQIKQAIQDKLLDHYGIVHFHIGKEDSQSQFVKRQGKILFAYILDKTAYLIGFFPHGKWSDIKPVEILYEEWPFLFQKIQNIEPEELTDQQREVLWRKNYNTILSINGESLMLGRPLGVSVNGASMLEIGRSIWCSRRIEGIYAYVYESIFSSLALRNFNNLQIDGELTPDGKVLLVLKNNRNQVLFVVDLWTCLDANRPKEISVGIWRIYNSLFVFRRFAFNIG